MKNTAQIVIFFLIVGAGFWIGTEWGKSKPEENVLLEPLTPQNITISRVGEDGNPVADATTSSSNTPGTTTTTEVVTPDATSNTTPTPATTTTTTETPTTPVTATTDTSTSTTTTSSTDIPLPKKTSDKVNHYSSSYAGYEFDIPSNMYFSAFGGGNGVMHTVGLGTDAVPEKLEDAAVRVYFYGKKIAPELNGTSKVVDPNGKSVYVLLDGAYSVRIEASDINHPVVQKILSTMKITQ